MNAPTDAAARAPHKGSAAARLLFSTAAYGAVLFLVAGTFRWPAGWVYLALNVLILGVYSAIVLRYCPDLIEERRKPPADAKKWDKALAAIVAGLGPAALLLVCGLDHRFRWSPAMPVALTVAGMLLMAAGGGLTNYAIAHNRFFSALVRIQRDRGHRVVDSGPYQFVRHPGYVGSMVHMAGSCLALGSWWALIVAASVAAVMVVRTDLEDRALQAELEGYTEYARHVRYRLLPWIW